MVPIVCRALSVSYLMDYVEPWKYLDFWNMVLDDDLALIRFAAMLDINKLIKVVDKRCLNKDI